MRVLVFGGTGMLGGAVVRQARSRGWAALGLSRQQADITDAERLRYWAETFRPSLIVNCAAFTKVDACESEQDTAMRINGDAIGNVVEAARAAGARLVQPSTDYVFAGDGVFSGEGIRDGDELRPYSEDDPTGPVSVYGASKLRGEELALAYDNALVVRVSWLFGPGGPNFVTTMIRLMDQGHENLRIVDDQVGGPTYTEFLARALLDLGTTDATGILHYQNRPAVSWCDFARAIVEYWKPDVHVEPVTSDEFPRPARRPAYSVLDVRRCEELLGRRVEPWSAGLAAYLAAYLNDLRNL